MCEPNVLVSSDYFNISICKCCNRVGMFYKNLLVGFEVCEFTNFCKEVTQLDFYNNCVYFPNGQTHLVVETCHQNIQFSFNESEFQELKSMLNESMLMLEVHQALEVRE